MNDKLYSGKFWLCITAALCLLGLTMTVCKVLWASNGAELGSGASAVIATLTTILTAIVTHYFTKRSEQ